MKQWQTKISDDVILIFVLILKIMGQIQDSWDLLVSWKNTKPVYFKKVTYDNKKHGSYLKGERSNVCEKKTWCHWGISSEGQAPCALVCLNMFTCIWPFNNKKEITVDLWLTLMGSLIKKHTSDYCPCCKKSVEHNKEDPEKLWCWIREGKIYLAEVSEFEVFSLSKWKFKALSCLSALLEKEVNRA